MRSLRTSATALAAAGLLAALFLMPAGSAMASTAAPLGQPEPSIFYYVCANGGAGLCLQNNGINGSVVANDNRITNTASNTHQLWTWIKAGVTSAKAPFRHQDLDKQITPGRSYGRWQIDDSSLCLAYLGGIVGLANCFVGTNGQPTNGTEWVLSGSGRMINVLFSDDTDTSDPTNPNPSQPGILQFLVSSQHNSGNPNLQAGNNVCPQACWGPEAG